MGKISVIIPTHNRADILPRAIKSIQDQTRPVDEIIVVSDGSTDNTEEVVRKLADKDSRIRLIAYHPGHNGNTKYTVDHQQSDDQYQKIQKHIDENHGGTERVGIDTVVINKEVAFRDSIFQSQISDQRSIFIKSFGKEFWL